MSAPTKRKTAPKTATKRTVKTTTAAKTTTTAKKEQSAKPSAKATADATQAVKPASKAKLARAAKPPAKTKPLKRPRYTKGETDALFARLAETLPEPKTELVYHNPYTLLVAVVLSAQATDAGVNKATGPLFKVADTPAAMAALGEDKLRDFIKTIGLFNTKAKNVIALSHTLIEAYGGEVPPDRDALQALPGVGRKTANVVLNVAFGEPTIAVDTHIFRVSNRLGLAPGKTPDEVEAQLERVTPDRFKRDAHHWLILHGRHVCKARRPLCEECVIHDLCKSPEKRPLAQV